MEFIVGTWGKDGPSLPRGGGCSWGESGAPHAATHTPCGEGPEKGLKQIVLQGRKRANIHRQRGGTERRIAKEDGKERLHTTQVLLSAYYLLNRRSKQARRGEGLPTPAPRKLTERANKTRAHTPGTQARSPMHCKYSTAPGRSERPKKENSRSGLGDSPPPQAERLEERATKEQEEIASVV